MATCFVCGKDTKLINDATPESRNYLNFQNEVIAWCADCDKKVFISFIITLKGGDRNQRTTTRATLDKILKDESISFVGANKEYVKLQVR